MITIEYLLGDVVLYAIETTVRRYEICLPLDL